MTARKIRDGELLAGLGGLALIGLLFAPWYQPPGAPTESAWHSLSAILAFVILAALLGIALLATTIFERTPALPVAASVFAVPFGIVAVLLVIIRVASPPDGAAVCWGAWAALACTVLVLAGALRSMRVDVRP